jgi:hypothetical protein
MRSQFGAKFAVTVILAVFSPACGDSGARGAPSGGGGGGSSTGASSGGSGGSHSVADCHNLPAAGVWERISPPGSDFTAGEAVLADGFQKQTDAIAIRPDNGALYVGVNQDGIHRSDDCGKTWEKVNTGANADLVNSGAPWNIVIDPVQPDTMYIVNGYGSNAWKTTNGGKDWQSLLSDDVKSSFVYGAVNSIAMDPTDPHHLLVSPHSGCTGALMDGCLAETKDGGATWRLVGSPSWDEGSGPLILNANTWLFASPMHGLIRSSDAGQTWSLVPGTTNAYATIYQRADGAWFVGSAQGVLQSADGANWNVPKGPGSVGTIVGNGTHLFAGSHWDHKLWQAPESDPTTWTEVAMPADDPMGGDGIVTSAYDRDHHLLYASRFHNGLWRLVID